jgi:hypothetical protein
MADAYHCRIHGLAVASEVVLPLPTIEPEPPDVTYRIALGAILPRSSYSRTNDPEEPWFVEHWLGDSKSESGPCGHDACACEGFQP